MPYKQPPSRRGRFLSANLSPESLDGIHAHQKNIKETTGGKVSTQDMVIAGVAMFFIATGKTPPTEELRIAVRPYLKKLFSPETQRIIQALIG